MTVTYSTDATIKAIFGNANWDTWTDKDNTQNSATQQAFSDAARVRSYRKLNNRMRATHYRIPIVDPSGAAPKEIEYLEAMIAGVDLASSRGEEDNGPDLVRWREEIERTFADIASGAMRLDAL